MPWRLGRSAPAAWSSCSSATPWPAANPSLPSMSASGRAATPRPAPNGPSTTTPRAIPQDNPSSPAGPIPGSPNSVSRGKAGPLRCACSGCTRKRTVTSWPPSRSRPPSPTCQPRAGCRGSSSLPATIRSSSPKRWVRRAPPLWCACVRDAVSLLTRPHSHALGVPDVMGTSSPVMRPKRGLRPMAISPSRTSSTAWCACGRGRRQLHPTPQGEHAQREARGRPPIVRGTLLLVEVSRLPQRTREPQALWLWWPGPPDAEVPDLDRAWRAYVRRFDVEHTFRFLKQTLNWTLPRVRHPEQADRWTWLVVLAYTQLRLARPLVVDQRLPWQRPQPAGKFTPARVQRGFARPVPRLPVLACPPKPCRRSPGRPKGKRSGRATRYPALTKALLSASQAA